MSATVQTQRRRDAQRNREAIMVAARELFAESTEVPMCEVARRAGVGQATLYRNFPDRRDLAAAVVLEHMESTERLAVEYADDPDAFFVLLRNVVETTARFHAIGELAREDTCLGSALDRCRRRMAELMKEPLRVAKASGALRRDLTVNDVFLVISMVRGAVDAAEDPATRGTSASRALALVLEGIAPPRMR